MLVRAATTVVPLTGTAPAAAPVARTRTDRLAGSRVACMRQIAPRGGEIAGRPGTR